MNDGRGLKAVRSAWRDFSEAAMVGPYREPYVTARKGRGTSGRDNRVGNRKAEAISDWLDRECARLAVEAYRRGDWCLSDERKCRVCGILYRIRPDHNGICLACELGVT